MDDEGHYAVASARLNDIRRRLDDFCKEYPIDELAACVELISLMEIQDLKSCTLSGMRAAENLQVSEVD